MTFIYKVKNSKLNLELQNAKSQTWEKTSSSYIVMGYHLERDLGVFTVSSVKASAPCSEDKWNIRKH